MLIFIVKCIYLMLPGIFANMAPVLIKGHWRFLEYPVDFNRKWRDGSPLLGSNKTWRGLIAGTLVAIGIVTIQKALVTQEAFDNISIFPYQDHSVWLVGFLIGFGVLFGDLVKSFFKRRFKIKPGERFVPWDQTDAVLGALVFIAFVWIPPWSLIFTLVVFSFILHIVIRHLGYYSKITKEKW